MQNQCRRLLCAFFLSLLARPSARAEGVYFTRDSVLKAFFATSERVTYATLKTEAYAARLRQALGELPPKKQYTVYVGQTHSAVDGYAVIDEEQGQHLPITFATQLSPSGEVLRTEVMAYREKYGEEIREERFREQFIGKGPGNGAHDVVAISGASISSASMGRAVARAVALVDALRATEGR